MYKTPYKYQFFGDTYFSVHVIFINMIETYLNWVNNFRGSKLHHSIEKIRP